MLFRAYFQTDRTGYIEYNADTPEEASDHADYLEQNADFPKDLTDVSDLGWTLIDIAPVNPAGVYLSANERRKEK